MSGHPAGRPAVCPAIGACKPDHTCTCRIFSNSRKWFSKYVFRSWRLKTMSLHFRPTVRLSVCPSVRPSNGASCMENLFELSEISFHKFVLRSWRLDTMSLHLCSSVRPFVHLSIRPPAHVRARKLGHAWAKTKVVVMDNLTGRGHITRVELPVRN